MKVGIGFPGRSLVLLAARLVVAVGSSFANAGQNLESATVSYRHTWEKAGEGRVTTTFQEHYWGVESGRAFLGFERADILAHEKHLEGMRRAGYREVGAAQVTKRLAREELATVPGTLPRNDREVHLPGATRRPRPAIEPIEEEPAGELPPDVTIGEEPPREEITDLEPGSADQPGPEPEDIGPQPEEEVPSAEPPPFTP